MIKSVEITLTHMVSQTEEHIMSDMDGEKVMLSVENGKYYNLGEVGSTIWDLLQEPIIVSNLVLTLMDQFDITQNECESQVLSFLRHLIENGLIQIENKSGN